MNIRVKTFYFVLAIIFLHYIIGWIAPVIFTALFAGIMLEDYKVVTSSAIGFIINAAGVLYTYLNFKLETIKMTALMDHYITNLTPWAIPFISVVMPTLLYAIAAYFSLNATYVVQKMRVNHNVPYRRSTWSKGKWGQ